MNYLRKRWESMDNVILIGFMGCGKSSIGRKLSYKLQKTLIDTDRLIEKEQDLTISEIFETRGEESFRDLETECLRSLLKNGGNQIISTGGGLPMREENRKLLKQLGCVVFLRATTETIYERLCNDTTRPLLQGADPQQKIAVLLKKRAVIYNHAADIVIDTDGKDFDQIISELQEALRDYEVINY